jgi:ABC-type branched-subunit amino acid transport system ATPase component
MKLTFVSPHKSITPFRELDLPDFVVLTGVNGAGKSHLLEAIENGCVRIDDIKQDAQTKPIRRFDWTNLVPQDSGAFMMSQIAQEKQGYWNELQSYISSNQSYYFDFLNQSDRQDLVKNPLTLLLEMTVDDLARTGTSLDFAHSLFQSIQSAIHNLNQNIIDTFTRDDPNKNKQRLIDLLQANAGVSIAAFDEETFYKFFPRNWMPIDIFQQSFSRLFADYQSNWLNNQNKLLINPKGKCKPASYLEEREFLDKYGEPPWDFVNSILESANIDFRIEQLSEYEGRSYEPILTDRTRGTHVKFADLSSGERVLMSFALCLYYAQDRRQIVNYPKILLFDEIDAPLHPSMTQSLLRIIQEVLIDRHKIKVILTTHSPSTVALSEESSIYAMYKDGNHRLKKVKKDTALAILTNGVPTLSISYENRRQVFVESEYDVQFYEQIYQKLKNRLSSEISLNFISSGSGDKGGCDRVRAIVNDLSKHGNKTVYGIIDWDLKNKHTERVKVLGQGNRYSIENYIFDPVILAAFLLLEGCITREMIGLERNETDFDLRTFESDRLQIAANFIVDKF